MNESEPGWYQSSDGEWHYWDGNQWNTPERTPDSWQVPRHFDEPPKPKKRSKLRNAALLVGAALGSAMILATGYFGAMWVSSAMSDDDEVNDAVVDSEPLESTTEATTREPAPTPTRTQAQERDDNMERDGYEVYDHGETYFRFVTDEESAQNPCDRYRCVDGIILSVSGCPSGFYVKGDILSNGVPVGWTNEWTASAQPHEHIWVRLEDYQGIGDEIRITEITCHRY